MGRDDEARFILGRLRGNDTREDKNRAEKEFLEIQAVAELEKGAVDGGEASYWGMFWGRGKLNMGRRVQLVIWLQIMQEWVGIAGVTVCEFFSFDFSFCFLITKKDCRTNVSWSYSDAPTIFRIAGFDAVKSNWISGLNNVFYMVRTPYSITSSRSPLPYQISTL